MPKDIKTNEINSRYGVGVNTIYIISIFLVFLIAMGVVPRQLAFLIAALYLYFVIFQPLKHSLFLFARSIPFFIALPITSGFDNFNTWRIVLFAMFLKWFITRTASRRSPTNLRIFANLRIFRIKKWWKNYRVECLGIILLFFACLSLFVASDFFAGAKRVIYFANLAMLFVVASSLIKGEKEIFLPLCKNILIGGAIVLFIGYFQYISAYFIAPIEVFHHWWGEQISEGFYGKNWSEIVMNFGNTWFSYTGGSLKLRMFSTFPDSHSFPLYLLMLVPFLFALFLIKNRAGFVSEKKRTFIFLFFLNLALILSCTRGIWLSIIFPIIFAVFLIWRKIQPSLIRKIWSLSGAREIILIVAFSLLTFVLLFPLANSMFSIPQFGLEKTPGTEDALLKRFRTATSTEETSNLGRIFIWKETFRSMAFRPFLGVGIGNFPVVLSQDVSLAKAGSSAHNLYLNVAAELGIFAMVVFLWFLFEIFKSAWILFNKSEDLRLKIFGVGSCLFLFWVFGYSLTDAALFDERTFLMFMLLCGMIIGLRRNINRGVEIQR